VLSSSSLPAREGARESSNGDAKGLIRESRLPTDSELQLVRRDDMADGEGGAGDSSRKRRVLDFFGGSNSSADPATCEGWLYNELPDGGDCTPDEGAVPGREGISEREEGCRVALGRSLCPSSMSMLSVAELRRM
jgi:hypothetical protein